MWPIIGIVFSAYVAGRVFGSIDAIDIDQRVRIDHFRRAAVVFGVFLALFMVLGVAQIVFVGPLTWWHLFWVLLAFSVFTPVDRFELNTSRRNPAVPYWYMGPHIRGPRESWYDGIWWAMTRRVVDTRLTNEGTHTTYSREGLSPFAAAMAFEISCFLLSIYNLLKHTT